MLKSSLILSLILISLSAENAFSFAPLQTTRALTKNVNPASFSDSVFHSSKNMQLNAFDPSFITSIDSSSISTSLDILTNENISVATKIATYGPQLLWLLLIVFPNTKITKTIMGSYTTIIAFSLVHLFIVVASPFQESGTAPIVEFNDVFDPSKDPQQAMVNMMRYPNFVSEEWSHVLTWDLFVGRWIWLDGLKRGIFTSHSVLFTNLIGPPGFLIHCATCLLTGKGIVGNEVPEEDEE